MLQSLSVKNLIAYITVTLLLLTTIKATANDDFLYETASGANKDLIKIIEEHDENSINSIDNIQKKADKLLELMSPEKILDTVKESILSNLSKMSISFTGTFVIIFISAILCCISQSFSEKSAFTLTTILFLILITLIPVSKCIDIITQTNEKLCAFMLSFIPSISAISAAGGNTISASASAVVCSSALSFLQILSSRLLIPGTKICVCFCAVGALGKNSELSGISSFIKSLCMWFSGIIMTIFCGVLSLQSFIGSGADSIAMRGLKFTAARLIPVAGGMISESLKTVIAGAGYIKGVAGTAAICYIIYTLLPAICSILCIKLLLYISGMCSRITGQKELQGYLDSLSCAVNMLFCVCAISCASFIVMLAIFMNTAVNI